MADDRKYRQPGYRSSDPARRDRQPPPSPPPTAPAPPGRMPASRTVSRCGECGNLLPPLREPTAVCPQCGLALHSCKQCAHFDPGQRFECAEAIPERLPDKRIANACPLFSLRVTVERETSSGGSRPDDARRAFDNLFNRKTP
jgi:predicted RNA-binding Zn-ribbon protein involved in translation (DUF1610 family)